MRLALRRLIKTLFAIVVLTVIAVAAILELEMFNSVRESIATDLLSDIVGEEITVDGHVDVALGPTVKIDLKGVAMSGRTTAGGEDVSPGEVSFTFPVVPALFGDVRIGGLTLSNVHIVIDKGAGDGESDPLRRQMADFVAEVTTSPLLGKLIVEDLKIEWVNDPNGWNALLVIDKATSSATDKKDDVYQLELTGSLNGQPLSLTGYAPDLNAAGGDDNIDLTFKGRGHSSRLHGRLTAGDGAPEFTGALESDTPSIGEFLEGLSLARVLEGTAKGRMKLSGPFDQLAATDLTLDVVGAKGGTLKLEGSVGDYWGLDNVDLKFDAKLRPAAEKASDSRLDFTPRAVSGHASGAWKDLTVDNVLIETNLAALTLTQVGPISIGKIRRSPDGLLQLLDVKLVEGDAKDPVLDVTGKIDNALLMSDWTFTGKFNFPMAGVLTGNPKAGDVGRLRGEIAASDHDGAATLDDLKAHVDGTKLIKLALSRGKSDKKNVLQVGLDIPDVAALGSALGGKPELGGRIGFDGALGQSEDEVTLNGTADLGESSMNLNLKTVVKDGSPHLSGSVRSKDFHLSSIPLGGQIRRVLRDRKVDSVKLREGARKGARVSLDIAADSVEGATEKAGALKAHLDYRPSHLALSKVVLAYLGGTISGAVEADLTEDTPKLKLGGKVRALNLDLLAKRLGREIGASGPLDVDIDVSANGDKIGPFLDSMTGKVNLAIFGGRLASDVIDLAGENIIGWAFSRSNNGAPLVCFVADFAFKDGVGVGNPVVLETGKVQVAGAGKLDLKAKTLNFVVNPTPLKNDLSGDIGPVSINGPIASPKVKLTDGAVAGKVLGDTVGLPLQIIGSILGGVAKGAGVSGPAAPAHKPCEVIAKAAPAQ